VTVLSHLTKISNQAVLNGTEKASIVTSINTLETRLSSYFEEDVSEKFKFGSSTRGTILPRNFDNNSDIDYMVVFSDDDFQPNTYLNKLKRFAETYYSSSNIRQSSPTMVLELNHIKFELVPAVVGGFFNPYKIPAPSSDYNDWMGTDPNDFNQTLTDANKSNNNLIKPLVRLLKYWNARNNYVFDSYSLEKDIVGMSFWYKKGLNEYFYSAVDQLQLEWGVAEWRTNKLSTLKSVVSNAETYESRDMPSPAEIEIKKCIPA